MANYRFITLGRGEQVDRTIRDVTQVQHDSDNDSRLDVYVKGEKIASFPANTVYWLVPEYDHQKDLQELLNGLEAVKREIYMTSPSYSDLYRLVQKIRLGLNPELEGRI